MRFEPFLLEEWIERKFASGWRIAHDFSSSAGPGWTVGELLQVAGGHAIEELSRLPVIYPSAAGSIELRTAIADVEGVSPEDVQIVTGAQEGLAAIFFTAAQPGGNVVLPHPGFPPFTGLPRGFGLDVRYYHLRAENGFEVDVDEVKSLCDARTALVLLNSPHNPTGSVAPEATRRDLHDFCAERGIQFLCDQVFHPIYYGPSNRTAAALPHATVLSDFSKALCLTGLRVGWIVERDRDRLEQYREARTYFTVSNSPVTEWLALLAIQHRQAIYARARDVSLANLELIESAWSSQTDRIEWVKPRGGFTVFPRVHGERNTRSLCERLGARGILVVPGDCFGVPSHVRVGFGADPSAFASGFERLTAEIEAYFSERREDSAVVVP
jgi:aspartate/methionine/tyrosine aminotransferase